jgi:hypothetical protein
VPAHTFDFIFRNARSQAIRRSEIGLVVNMVGKTMSRSDDHDKLSAKERGALEKYVRENPGSTLLKDERTAQYLQRMRLREQGQTAAKPREILRDAAREEKYGSADWAQFDDIAREWPDLTKLPARQPSGALWNALEQFIRSSKGSIKNFRDRYPAFLPSWFYGLRWGNYAEPQCNTGLSAWQAFHSLLREAWHSGFHSEYVAQLVNIPTLPPGNTHFEIAPVCDAQRAVLAMALETWRARFCPRCGRPFVARRAADKYWPRACFAEQRREKQRASKRKRARKRAKSSRRTK